MNPGKNLDTLSQNKDARPGCSMNPNGSHEFRVGGERVEETITIDPNLDGTRIANVYKKCIHCEQEIGVDVR